MEIVPPMIVPCLKANGLGDTRMNHERADATFNLGQFMDKIQVLSLLTASVVTKVTNSLYFVYSALLAPSGFFKGAAVSARRCPCLRLAMCGA